VTPDFDPGELVGRHVTGVVPLAPRSFALALLSGPGSLAPGASRAFLWVHVDRKTASIALAEDLPIRPDPRGSRFGGLEEPLRGTRIVESTLHAGTLRIVVAPEATASAELTIGGGGKRANVVLRQMPEGTVLWALHRDETEPTSPGPPGFQAPRVLIAGDPAARETLRGSIEASFREDFEREARKALDRAERTLARRAEALEGDRERARDRLLDRRRGEILLAHLKEVPRGASRVGLPDPYADSPGTRIEIDLDPSLSPHENAARLFRAAKRGERGEERIEARLRSAREALAKVADLRRVLFEHPPKEALAMLEALLGEKGLSISGARGDQREIRLGRRTTMAPRAGRPGRPSGAHHPVGPRTFTTSDGWKVWVGRNNTQNDEITHRLSNPHDYWLHVVGVPGSHVILRRPSRTAIPKRRTLEEAAMIAAWFSKARKLSRVPVIYTERKFVTKPRRGKPGQALCSREKELLVRPRLPEGDAGTEG
jgi:hypothetical protein